jgi:hypothetical protein
MSRERPSNIFGDLCENFVIGLLCWTDHDLIELQTFVPDYSVVVYTEAILAFLL